MEVIGNVLDPSQDPANIHRNIIMLQYLQRHYIQRNGELCVTFTAARELTQKAENMIKPGYENEEDLEIIRKLPLKKKGLRIFYESYEKSKARKE